MQKTYELIAGENRDTLKTISACTKLYPTLAPMIKELSRYIKLNSLMQGRLQFIQKDQNFSLNFLNKDSKKGEILIEILGTEDVHRGVPYYSSWDGLFYRLLRNKRRPYVKNGQFVKKGGSVGIIYINKNEQFLLEAPSDGHIYFPEKDEALGHGILLKSYEQNSADQHNPIFYLK